ncbi:hypothetical protein BYT27DRAFT_6637960 [Phlegmacium glaucopus]|nr:hypothetical protein BYT27DRAFT_6637960 [Phlegmacium glaucopus]
MAMFENARDFEISGGTFIVEHGQNALQVLKEHAAPGAFHNSSERYDPPKCHPQTRLAVLDAIMDWLNDNEKTAFVIWLYGPAGAGKSTIAQTIAEICARLQILLASFFWSRNSHGRNDENRLITSLAYQLIVAIPQMRIHVESVIKNDPLIFSRSLETQMESLIVEPLGKTFPNNREQNADEEKPKLIILDGLDECGLPSAQAYILKVISTAVQRFPIPIYILIASRPEQEIRDSFNSQSLLSITTRIALDDTYHPDDDIRTFLVDNFTSLKATKVGSLLPAQWPTSEDVETLVKKSTGQFIYASTVLKFVKHPRRRPDKQLKIIFGISGAEKQTPFAELDTLYLHIFSTVEDLAQAHNILSCLFFFPSQYLIVEDIEKLLFYEHGELHLILSDLYSVVDVPDITDSDIPLRVFHASLQDFLMDPNRSGAFYLDEGITRAQLTQYFMRHIRNFPTVEMDPGTVDYLTSNMFVKNCLKSSPTKELIQDLLIFDFKQWVLTTCLNFLHPLQVFERVILLSAWFRIHVRTLSNCRLSLSTSKDFLGIRY